MCKFIKYNHNLETIGLNILSKPRDYPFIEASNPDSIRLFVLLFNNHPSIQKLYIYNMQTYTLKAFGDEWGKRIKDNAIGLTEFYIHQVSQNNPKDPGDHYVFPALIKITNKIPWLQYLELKISVFCNLHEIMQICKLLKQCNHLNGIKFQCNIGEMFSNKQILQCVDEIYKIFKEIKEVNSKQKKNEIINIISKSLVNANNNDNINKEIAVHILSFADLSFAFDAGLLFFESTFLNKINIKDRKNINDFLLGNWRKLPFAGKNISDKRYKLARSKIIKLDKKINGDKPKEK